MKTKNTKPTKQAKTPKPEAKKKLQPPVTLNMSFDEAMRRIMRVSPQDMR